MTIDVEGGEPARGHDAGATTGGHRVVIVGGGFGGLHAAKTLRDPRVRVTLVDRRNFHLFQPLLYQVATGGISPADIATPLRYVLRRQRNARVVLDEVVDLDVVARRVVSKHGAIDYDSLILATGARHHYFGNDAWEALAPGLKTLEDATEMRARIFHAFEVAEREHDPDTRRSWLTFGIVGGGPTGVELAGALAELARETLRRDFRAIDPTEARILLLEGADRILSTFPERLSHRAADALARLGVEVRTGTRVVDVREDRVVIRSGDDESELPMRTVLWAAGVRSSGLGRVLARETGVELDELGRVRVEPDLSVPGRPETFVVGDLARVEDASGEPLPGVAPVAMQAGRHAARVILARLDGRRLAPFRYRDKGSLAVIGRTQAVVRFPGLRMSGTFAWLLWIFVHILYLVEFENRVLVAIQWAWTYLTRNRSARLITYARDGGRE